MARANYHRDLLGTTFAVGGAAFFAVMATLPSSEIVVVAALGLASCIATWRARMQYPELSTSEALFASALAIAILFSVRRWYDGDLQATLALALWAVLAITGSSLGVFAAMRLPRTRRRVIWLHAGLIGVAVHVALILLAIVNTNHNDEDMIVLTCFFGGLVAGAVAIRLVPDATPAQIFWGSTVLLLMISFSTVAAYQTGMIVGLVTGVPILTILQPLGALIARPRRKPEPTLLPEARAHE